MTVDDTTRAPSGVSRRQVLRGGVVMGATVWVAPVIQTLGMGVADAASGATGSTPPPVNTALLPSHGLFVVVSGTRRYGYKFDPKGVPLLDKIASPSDGAYMREVTGGTFFDPVPAVTAHITATVGLSPAGTPALVVLLAPTLTLLNASAYTFDGSFQHCADPGATPGKKATKQDKYEDASVVAPPAPGASPTTIFFTKACDTRAG